MPDFRARPVQTAPAVQLGRPANGLDGRRQAAGAVLQASTAAALNGRIDAVQAELDETQLASVIALALSPVFANDRQLAAGPDIDFVDGGPKATLSFALKTTGIAPATYGAALKIPIITFDDKGRATLASEATLGTAALLDSDNDATLSANSNSRAATQAAIKAYVDNAVSGLLDFKGNLNCSANPNYPAAQKGDAYLVSAAGKIGGASGLSVEVGDVIVASADNAGGTQAAVGGSWFILEHNLQGALQSANNLGDVPNPLTARGNLGLAIGSDVQAYDADLAAIAALSTTAFGRAILALVDQAAVRAYIGAAVAANFSSGSYTPALTNVANVDASTAYPCQWKRQDNMVTVSGRIDIDPTAVGVATSVDLSLPVPTNNFTGDQNAGGTAACAGIQQTAAIFANVGAQTVRIGFVATDASNRSFRFDFMYQVI